MVMEKSEVLNRIYKTGIVAVVRAESLEKARKIVDACIQGGIDIVEITMTVPGAVNLIEELSSEFSPEEVVIGAGTVLDAPTAAMSFRAGANFIVAPAFCEETVKFCNINQVAVVPGAMTPTEVLAAKKAGADVVKVFPADLFGPKIIKNLKGPLPKAKLLPTGGVNVENVDQWIKAGSFAVGVGGALTAGAKTEDYKKITETGKEFLRKIREARAN